MTDFEIFLKKKEEDSAALYIRNVFRNRLSDMESLTKSRIQKIQDSDDFLYHYLLLKEADPQRLQNILKSLKDESIAFKRYFKEQ